MTVYIIFTSFGSDAGPFNLYSDVDGFSSAFASGVTKLQLITGFSYNSVPDGTTIIRAQSFGVCTNFVDLPINLLPTTSTTSSSTTIAPSTTTTTSNTTGLPIYTGFTMSNVSDELTPNTACTNQSGLAITKYHSGEAIDPIVGDTIFNDINGTSTFNGNARFWKFDKNGLGFGAMKISTTGIVIQVNTCP
jgi:hypothetical protein